jgi:cytochrome c oxidase subunit III
MISFLVSEVAFFCTLIVVYLADAGKTVPVVGEAPAGSVWQGELVADQSGPTPAVLSLRLVIGTTVCLLLSSGTVHMAEKSLRSGAKPAFLRWWTATILLGIAFLAGTGFEWSTLISEHGLTISRNLFGTTYYTLVGFHALHVTVGVIVMLILLALTPSFRATAGKHVGVELVSWYWHFVDGVWLVVFTVVYLVGR